MAIGQRLDQLEQRIQGTALWSLMQASVLVVTVGLLPFGIGCTNENSPSASEPSAKESAEDEALLQFQRGIAERAMALPPEEWNDRLKEAIVQAGWDLDEFTESIRQRQARQADSNAPADEGSRDEEEALREFQRGVVERAMALPPEEWNDRLKEAIAQAGWDLDEFTESIRQRQARQARQADSEG